MNNKKNYGQFYTTNSEYIIGNLLKDIQLDKKIIEPFCGEKDLMIVDGNWEIYDIDPKHNDIIKQDTLLNPPNYQNTIVITNPPFLYRNKSTDKTIYDKYNVTDLYKAAILSIKECDGGILIVPLNFLCDEDDKIRNEFFSLFRIVNLNIFEETVFDDTSYTICSFSFIRKETETIEDIITATLFPSNISITFAIKQETGWRIGDEFHKIILNQKNIGISRLTEGGKPNSNIYLRAIDTGTQSGRIELMINDNPFYGKNTDRTFATIVMDKIYKEEEEKIICDKFNNIFEYYRTKYNSLFLTNYRNSTSSYSRKRISFDVAYKLISYIVQKEI